MISCRTDFIGPVYANCFVKKDVSRFLLGKSRTNVCLGCDHYYAYAVSAEECRTLYAPVVVTPPPVGGEKPVRPGKGAIAAVLSPTNYKMT